MAGIYRLKVLTDFAAAHVLRGYDGKCSRLHGHNWKVEAEVQGTRLDDVGMVIDFKAIKRAANDVAERLDHYYLNDIPPFDQINPTAENIACYFYQELGKLLNDEHVRVCNITLWENDRACVNYSEPE